MSQRPTYWYKKHEKPFKMVYYVQYCVNSIIFWHFRRVFMEIKAFVLSVTRNNLKVKKVIISLKKPSKWSIMNSTYLLWRPYVKIYEKRYKKSASSYHTQTGYLYKPARLFELITMFQGLNTSYVLQTVSKVIKPHW